LKKWRGFAPRKQKINKMKGVISHESLKMKNRRFVFWAWHFQEILPDLNKIPRQRVPVKKLRENSCACRAFRQRNRKRRLNLMNKECAYELDCEKQEIERKIMTLEEVADLLRVHRSTVSRYAKSGELGNRRLFKSGDVWSFFENQVALECVSGKEEL
jgi:excisionase family DNA binding protein